MNDNVYVSLEVPLGSPDGNNYPMVFHCWLPIREADQIHLDSGDWSLQLSFSTPNPSEDEKYANASIDRVFAHVILQNVSDELINGIVSPPEYSSETDIEELRNNVHIRLAEDVVRFVVERVNRLISYVRNHRGQFLMEEIPPLHYNVTSSLLQLKARIRVGDGEWKSWRPPGGAIGWTAKGYEADRRRIVNKEDWPTIQRFVASDERTGLVRQLLTGAEALAEENHRRAALTEAVTALEVAIHEFSRYPSARAFGAEAAERMDLQSLNKQVGHMGLSGSVRYLLPLILPNEIVATDILRECSRAIDLRQNIVHNGQRDVNVEKVRSALKAIRELCLLLEKLQQESPIP